MILDDSKVPVNLEEGDFNDRSTLSVAVETGNMDAVNLLLTRVRWRDLPKVPGASYIDPDLRDWTGSTALFLAAQAGYAYIVDALLEFVGNVNIQNQENVTPLMAAAKLNRLSVVKRLLDDRRIKPNKTGSSRNTALHEAANYGHFKMAKHFLAQGIRIRLQVPNSGLRTPLALAARNGMIKTVKALLTTSHPDSEMEDAPDLNGHIPLTHAVVTGHIKIVRSFLASTRLQVDNPDTRGVTPLMTAARVSYLEVVKLLLRDGRVDPDRTGPKHNYTAFTIAAQSFGKTSVVKELVQDRRVSLDGRDDEGCTSLVEAARFRHTDIVRILLVFGRVNPNVADNLGRTPL
ncbi:ankyrin repeat-containing domain protein [Podospora fimiseda]|uniref:Ankyrin repeat-containing domain protein n=1 Tax=Podospora fimiseda TaxID=252190 RepID=A0AAN7BGY4_9PEZI|nr:ankyrin repeat-containing domain protein [Podospora fimiseda]